MIAELNYWIHNTMNNTQPEVDALKFRSQGIYQAFSQKADELISDGSILVDYKAGMPKVDIYDKYQIKESLLDRIIQRAGLPKRPYGSHKSLAKIPVLDLPPRLIQAVKHVRYVSRSNQSRLAAMCNALSSEGELLGEFARMIHPTKLEDLERK
jgi:hypothetical protein